MLVSELIERLKEFPQDLEIKLYEGYPKAGYTSNPFPFLHVYRSPEIEDYPVVLIRAASNKEGKL